MCGKAEQNPALKLLFTAEKPLIPAWLLVSPESRRGFPLTHVDHRRNPPLSNLSEIGLRPLGVRLVLIHRTLDTLWFN